MAPIINLLSCLQMSTKFSLWQLNKFDLLFHTPILPFHSHGFLSRICYFFRMASFSNWGAPIALAAPGASVWAACSGQSSQCSGTNTIIAQSGTSMACPLVAGQIARLRPGTTQSGVAAHLRSTAGSSHGKLTLTGNQAQTPNRLAWKYDC